MIYRSAVKWFYLYAILVALLSFTTPQGILILVLAGASCAGIVFSEAMFRHSVVAKRYNQAVFSRAKGAAGATQLGMIIMVLYSWAPDAHLFQSSYALTLVTAIVSGMAYIPMGTVATIGVRRTVNN